MIECTGTRFKGLGDATGNMGIQIPMIVKEFPEVSVCKHGTINLILDKPLIVVSPDHRTRPIPWKQGPEFGDGEVFDFLRIEIEGPIGSKRYPAWLYLSHITPWRSDPRRHEVIAAPLPVEDVQNFKIIIHRHAAILPYKDFPAVVVL